MLKVVFLALTFSLCLAVFPSHRVKDTLRSSEHVGGEVFFTPALKKGEPEIAREAGKVTIGGLTSYAGFFTVNATTDNNMYMWYFPAQSNKTDVPLVIWLQGGPGGSSMFGLFSEMGPWSLDKNAKGTYDLKLRPHSWNKEYAMLFIDNPVGAGFSYTGTGKGYATNEQMVAADLYELLQQFYVVFPETYSNKLFITGESYGGHYVPAISYKIHVENQKKQRPNIPLGGLAIGDGWIDPVNMIPAYPDMMVNFGLADANQKRIIEDYCDRTVNFINKGQMLDAFNVWDEMLNGDIFPYPNYFHNITGSNDYDNFMRTNPPEEFGYYAPFLNQPEIRAAIHVGDKPFNNGHECEMHLLSDFMVSLRPEITVLMDNYPVLIYSGQLDIIIGAPLTERFLPYVDWSGQNEYLGAERLIWRIQPSDAEVAGYVREVKQFKQVIIRGAGHIAPYDQPERSLDMITRFIEGKSFA